MWRGKSGGCVLAALTTETKRRRRRKKRRSVVDCVRVMRIWVRGKITFPDSGSSSSARCAAASTFSFAATTPLSLASEWDCRSMDTSSSSIKLPCSAKALAVRVPTAGTSSCAAAMTVPGVVRVLKGARDDAGVQQPSEGAWFREVWEVAGGPLFNDGSSRPGGGACLSVSPERRTWGSCAPGGGNRRKPCTALSSGRRSTVQAPKPTGCARGRQ